MSGGVLDSLLRERDERARQERIRARHEAFRIAIDLVSMSGTLDEALRRLLLTLGQEEATGIILSREG